MSEELQSVSEVVESWNVPVGAARAGLIRRGILAAIGEGYEDPQLVADLAVGPLVVALGELEVGLADARRRIAELERALGRRDAS